MIDHSPAAVGAQDVEAFVQWARQLEGSVTSVIVGQDQVVRETLIALLAGGHVLLEGVPGLGKTLLVHTLANALDLAFSRIQFTPDLMPADITGTSILQEAEDGKRILAFQPGPLFANVILADEINRATPKTQSALLEAMQEGTVSAAGQTRPLPSPFFVLATQNPLEMEGTYPLPEAQLDRFLLKVMVPFPGADVLKHIVHRTLHPGPGSRDLLDATHLARMSEITRVVPIAEPIVDVAVAVVVASHPDISTVEVVRRYVRAGASPRGLQALALGAQVRALLEGRYNVAIEDIHALAPAALRHRIVLNFEGQAEGITTDDIVAAILTQVAA